MLKNVASQKLIVFAWDATTGLPKTGDAANLTAYVSKDYGSVTVLTDTSATEMDATNGKGYYLFDLAQAETNADTLLFTCKSSTANIAVVAVPAVVFTRPSTGLLAPTTAGRTLDVSTGGEAGVDWANVGSPTTSVNLSGTTIATTQKVDVETIKTQAVTCAAGVTIRADVGAAAAPGSANGMLIGGSNAATTFNALTVTNATTLTGAVALQSTLTVTGAVACNAGVTFTNSAGDAFACLATGGNGDGAYFEGQGTGDGLHTQAGATGRGIHALGGGTSGAGLLCVATTSGSGAYFQAAGTNQPAIGCTVGGTGAGILIMGGDTSGAGIEITTTSGDGILVTPTAGNALTLTGNGTSKHGAVITGGTAGTSDGLKLAAGTGGVGFRLDTLTASGAVSLGSTLTVTGATTLTGTVTATDASNDIRGVKLASTGLAAVTAWTVDITGSLSGSVGSVTGSVGSVTGAVGSVTGAVGSVTGNVGGNVTGTIGGLTAAALKDFFDTDSTTTYASAVAGSVVKEIADNAGGSALTTDAIAEAMFTYAASASYATANAASVVKQIADNAGGSALTVQDIVDGVWNEDATGHQTQGTFGQAVGDPTTGISLIARTPNAAAGASGGLLISGSNSGTTTLGALTVSGATTLTGAVSLGSTLGVTGTTTLAAVTTTGTVTFNAFTVSNATTLTGAVSLGSTLGITGTATLAALTVSGATTLTGAVAATNASNDIRGVKLAATGLAAVTAWTVDITGSLSGSVGSVSGAVGSVTGAVGSVTGNVGGNVVGSVGSISGVSFPSNFGALAITAGGIVSADLQTIKTQTVTCAAGVTVLASVGTASTSTAQTGDAYARLGAPAGASVSADIAAVKVDTAAILDDTGTSGVVVAAGSKTGYALTSAYDFAKGTVAMTEAYAANGVAPTPVQALYAMQQYLTMFAISGTSYSVKKLDGTTEAFVVTLNDGTTPTAATRA